MEPLKVGLLGLGRGGQEVARALLTSSWCRLTAVASSKRMRLEEFAAHHDGVTVYDDYRSLIVGAQLDALFVALPPFLRPRYLAMAAERHLPVWMLSPPAQRFQDAFALTQQFEDAECPIVVARAWGSDPALRPDFLGLDQLGRLFLCRGEVLTCWGGDFDWRGDRGRAGGGALLDRGYTLVDAVVQAMGLPATVFAAVGGVARKNGRYRYDTEDTAAVICQFDGGAVAALTASWTAGPDAWRLDLHGSDASVHVDRQTVAVRDAAGAEVLREQARRGEPLLPPIEDFLSALRSNPRTLRSRLREHLPSMAVIEAAYLSARTGQPESPGKIVDMHSI